MSITITRPQQTIEIVTDLIALQDSVLAANEYLNAKDKPGMTEAEASELDALYQRMQKSKQKADESTIILELKGLNASKWRLLTLQFTATNEDGQVTRDLVEQIAAAIPEMYVSAAYKQTGEKISKNDITQLIPELTDSQLNDLLVLVQNLNDPVTSLPKEIYQLLSA